MSPGPRIPVSAPAELNNCGLSTNSDRVSEEIAPQRDAAMNSTNLVMRVEIISSDRGPRFKGCRS